MNKLFKDNYYLMHTGKSNGFIYQTSHQDLLHLPKLKDETELKNFIHRSSIPIPSSKFLILASSL